MFPCCTGGEISRNLNLRLGPQGLMLDHSATVRSVTLQYDDLYIFSSSTLSSSFQLSQLFISKSPCTMSASPKPSQQPLSCLSAPELREYFANILTRYYHIPAPEAKQQVEAWEHGTGAFALSLDADKYRSIFGPETGMLLYNHVFPAPVSRLSHTLSVPLRESKDTPRITVFTWIRAVNPFFMFRKSWTRTHLFWGLRKLRRRCS
jgi:hypothetical protein